MKISSEEKQSILTCDAKRGATSEKIYRITKLTKVLAVDNV